MIASRWWAGIAPVLLASSGLLAQDIAPSLTVSGTQNQATATWTLVRGAVGYQLVRREVTLDPTGRVVSAQPWATVTQTTAASYTDILPKPAAYEYRVDAATRIAVSSAVVRYLSPPFTTPTGPTVTGAGDRATVAWGAAVGVTGYQVWRQLLRHDGTVSDRFQRGAVAATVTSYTDAVATNGEVYQYWVVSTDASGGTWPTPMVNYQAPTVVAPVVAVAGAADRAVVSWTPTAGASGYQVSRAPVDKTGRMLSPPVQLATLPGTATTYTDAVPSPSAVYQYVVSAVLAGGSTLPSQPMLYGSPAFTTPGNIMVAGAGGRVGISWCQAVGAAGYQVWRRQVNPDGTTSSPLQRTTSLLTVTGFTDDLGSTAGAVEYQVIAVGQDGRLWPSIWVRIAGGP